MGEIDKSIIAIAVLIADFCFHSVLEKLEFVFLKQMISCLCFLKKLESVRLVI